MSHVAISNAYFPRILSRRALLWSAWIVMALLGSYGLALRIFQGHLPAGYGSYVPWGLWIAIYFHGVGMAGGAFFIGALGYQLHWPGFHRSSDLRLAIVLAAAAIVPAFFAVWLDLGQLGRFHTIFLRPSFGSMMAFNAWMYVFFLVVAGLCWWLTFWKDQDRYPRLTGWLKPLLSLAMLFAVLFPSQSGAFFGVVSANSYWHSGLLPALFLASALTSGAALLMVARAITGAVDDTPTVARESRATDQAMGKLRIWVLVGLLVYLGLEFAEFSIAYWSPAGHAPALDLVLWGPYWWVFWIVHLLVGALVPIALLVSPLRMLWTKAALLVAVCFISARLNVLVPGQAVADLQGLREAFQHPRLEYIYHATAMEYLVGLFCVVLGVAVFYVGMRVTSFLSARFTARRMGFNQSIS